MSFFDLAKKYTIIKLIIHSNLILWMNYECEKTEYFHILASTCKALDGMHMNDMFDVRCLNIEKCIKLYYLFFKYFLFDQKSD